MVLPSDSALNNWQVENLWLFPKSWSLMPLYLTLFALNKPLAFVPVKVIEPTPLF